MDADKLPSEHDVIVLGTGMTESIIAAALSRIGLRVLHLDRNDSYGGDWGSFNFSAIEQWISTLKGRSGSEVEATKQQLDLSSLLSTDEKPWLLPLESSTISNIQEFIHIPGTTQPSVDEHDETSAPSPRISPASETGPSQVQPNEDAQTGVKDAEKGVGAEPVGETAETAEKKTSPDGTQVTAECSEKKPESKTESPGEEGLDFAGVKKLWRKFNIDLMPKVLYSRGPLVELLISSDVAKYCEFRSITRVLTLLKGKLELVPCSRADVFASHDVSVIEKRLLMKFLTFAIEYQKHPAQYAGFEERPFVEFLKSKSLTETIQHYVQHAIAMVTEAATTMEGLEATQKFLLSLGRYGNTAFLWPLYGSGELLQCFCRMCAVFGGIYCLRRTAQAIVLNNSDEIVAIVDTEGQRLETKWVVMDSSYASSQFLPQIQEVRRLSRAVLITDRSVRIDKEQHITVMSLPLPGRNDSRATVYELSSLSLACPEGFHVVHLICRSLASDAKTDLQPIIDVLFQPPEQENVDDNRPRIIWSLFYNVVDTSKTDLTCSAIRNLVVVGGPDSSLDCDQSIATARTVFERICPGEEFLPKAPNPEDIIFDDGEGSPPRESGFEPIPEASIETEGAETVTAETAQCSDATGPNSAGVASKSSGKGEVGVTSGHVDATSGDGDTCVATGDGAQSDCSGVASASP